MEAEESAERISLSLKEGDQRPRGSFEKNKIRKGFIVSGYYAMTINSVTVTILHACVLFSETNFF